ARARVKDAGGDLVQHERAVGRVHCVARVGATLVADYERRVLGERIHHLAFALIAPLGADDDQAVRLRPEHRAYAAARRPAAASTSATRARCRASRSTRGRRIGPHEKPTMSIAVLMPAGPNAPTISRCSGASRSWSEPAVCRSSARKAR